MFRSLPSLPTFKSLPSAIGLPFLSTTEDAQLKFKSGDGGVRKLYGDEVSSSVHSYPSSQESLDSSM